MPEIILLITWVIMASTMYFGFLFVREAKELMNKMSQVTNELAKIAAVYFPAHINELLTDPQQPKGSVTIPKQWDDNAEPRD
jgi:hypothetical protein